MLIVGQSDRRAENYGLVQGCTNFSLLRAALQTIFHVRPPVNPLIVYKFRSTELFKIKVFCSSGKGKAVFRNQGCECKNLSGA